MLAMQTEQPLLYSKKAVKRKLLCPTSDRIGLRDYREPEKIPSHWVPKNERQDLGKLPDWANVSHDCEHTIIPLLRSEGGIMKVVR